MFLNSCIDYLLKVLGRKDHPIRMACDAAKDATHRTFSEDQHVRPFIDPLQLRCVKKMAIRPFRRWTDDRWSQPKQTDLTRLKSSKIDPSGPDYEKVLLSEWLSLINVLLEPFLLACETSRPLPILVALSSINQMIGNNLIQGHTISRIVIERTEKCYGALSDSNVCSDLLTLYGNLVNNPLCNIHQHLLSRLINMCFAILVHSEPSDPDRNLEILAGICSGVFSRISGVTTPEPAMNESEIDAMVSAHVLTPSPGHLDSNHAFTDAVVIIGVIWSNSIIHIEPGTLSNVAVRSRMLALRLMSMMIEGHLFQLQARSSLTKFLLRKWIIMTIMSNGTIANFNLFKLCMPLVSLVVTNFLPLIRTDIEAIYETIYFPSLMNPAVHNPYGLAAIQGITTTLSSKHLLDLFFYYHYDITSMNILGNLLYICSHHIICKHIHPPTGVEAQLKYFAFIICSKVISILSDLKKRYRVQKIIPTARPDGLVPSMESPLSSKAEMTIGLSMKIDDQIQAKDQPLHPEKSIFSPITTTPDIPLSQIKLIKHVIYQLSFHFKDKPKEAIKYLVRHRICQNDNKSIAEFLHYCSALDHRVLGSLLGEPEHVEMLAAFMDCFDFRGLEIDQALGNLFAVIRPPGEAQQISRFMENFSMVYAKQNPTKWTVDVAYFLAMAVVMLSTSLHNPAVPANERITPPIWKRMLADQNEGHAFPEDVVVDIFNRISKQEFRDAPSSTLILDQNGLIESIKTLNGSLANHFEAVRKGLTCFYDGLARRNKFAKIIMDGWRAYNPSERPKSNDKSEWMGIEMLEAGKINGPLVLILSIVAPPLSTTLSSFMQFRGASNMLSLAFDCIYKGATLACELDLPRETHLFLKPLLKTLEPYAFPITPIQLSCLQLMLQIGQEQPNMHSHWTDVFRCVHMIEILHSASAVRNLLQTKPDLFSEALAKHREQLSKTLKLPDVDEQLLARLLSQIQVNDPNRLFNNSSRLSDDNLIEFVLQLCSFALEKLETPELRTHAIQKIVEVVVFNIDRPEHVLKQLWDPNVCPRLFRRAGTFKDKDARLVAMDCLRQIAYRLFEVLGNGLKSDAKPPDRGVLVVIIERIFGILPDLYIAEDVLHVEYLMCCLVKMVSGFANLIPRGGWMHIFSAFKAATSDVPPIAKVAVEQLYAIFPAIEADGNLIPEFVKLLEGYSRYPVGQSLVIDMLKRVLAKAATQPEAAAGVRGPDKRLLAPPARPLRSAGRPPDDIPTTCIRAMAKIATFASLELSFRVEALDALFGTLVQHGPAFGGRMWDGLFKCAIFPTIHTLMVRLDDRDQDRTPTHDEPNGIGDKFFFPTTQDRVLVEALTRLGSFYLHRQLCRALEPFWPTFLALVSEMACSPCPADLRIGFLVLRHLHKNVSVHRTEAEDSWLYGVHFASIVQLDIRLVHLGIGVSAYVAANLLSFEAAALLSAGPNLAELKALFAKHARGAKADDAKPKGLDEPTSRAVLNGSDDCADDDSEAKIDGHREWPESLVDSNSEATQPLELAVELAPFSYASSTSLEVVLLSLQNIELILAQEAQATSLVAALGHAGLAKLLDAPLLSFAYAYRAILWTPQRDHDLSLKILHLALQMHQRAAILLYVALDPSHTELRMVLVTALEATLIGIVEVLTTFRFTRKSQSPLGAAVIGHLKALLSAIWDRLRDQDLLAIAPSIYPSLVLLVTSPSTSIKAPLQKLLQRLAGLHVEAIRDAGIAP